MPFKPNNFEKKELSPSLYRMVCRVERGRLAVSSHLGHGLAVTARCGGSREALTTSGQNFLKHRPGVLLLIHCPGGQVETCWVKKWGHVETGRKK